MDRKNTQVPIPGGSVATILEPERQEFDGNLGGAIEYRLAHVLYSIARIMGSGLGEFFGGFLVHTLEILRPELIGYVAPLIDEILAIPDLPPGFKEFLRSIRYGEGQAAAALLAGVGSTAGGAAIGGLIPTLLAPATYALAGAMTPARPSPAEAFAMHWRDHFDEDTLRDQLKDQGWHLSTIRAFDAILRPRLGPGELYQDSLRGNASFRDVYIELNARGWTDDDILKMEGLTKQIPGPGDQVRFALREAWRDDVAQKFDYDADMPPEFTEWMAKLGFDPIWAKNFWRAHWDLPSIQAGFEMLQRRVITESELDTLLRVADIPAFWRDKLKRISFSPYTRVDVRRMHQIGILSDSQLIDAYRDLGFDLEHASGMAEFTVAYNANTDKEYSKGEILQGYRLRALSNIQAMQLLVEMGQSQEHAEYVLALEDYKVANTLQKAQVEVIEDRYVAGDIDRVATLAQLGEMGMRSAQMDVLFAEWDIMRQKAVRRPTKTDVRNFYRLGIIEREQVRTALENLHVPDAAIGFFLEQWDGEIGEESQKELERQQREQERLETATFRTDRMVAVQRINVLVAEQRTVIADARLALTEIRPPGEVANLENTIKELQVGIRVQETQIRERQALAITTKELIRITPEPEVVATLTREIDAAQEEIATLRVHREELQTEIAELEVIVVTFPDTVEAMDAEIDQVQLVVDIEVLETAIARVQEQITLVQNVLFLVPEAEMLDALRARVGELTSDIAGLRTAIATSKIDVATNRAELTRMPTPGQALELKTVIVGAKATISQLQLQKARIPVTAG